MKPLSAGEAQALLLWKLFKTKEDTLAITLQKIETVGGVLGHAIVYHFQTGSGAQWRVVAETAKIIEG